MQPSIQLNDFQSMEEKSVLTGFLISIIPLSIIENMVLACFDNLCFSNRLIVN